MARNSGSLTQARQVSKSRVRGSLLGLGASDADGHLHGDDPRICVMDPPTHRDVKPSKVVSGVGVSRAHVCAAVAVKTNAWQT